MFVNPRAPRGEQEGQLLYSDIPASLSKLSQADGHGLGHRDAFSCPVCHMSDRNLSTDLLR